MADPRTVIAARLGVAAGDVVPMPAKGVAHDHYRIQGRGLVARVPRPSPWALPATQHLAYETACFRGAEPSGATPRLDRILAVEPDLPRGALLVEEIVGRPVRLPGDFEAMADALAKLHGLPLPSPNERAPLPDHGVNGPVRSTLAIIEQHAGFLPEVDLPPRTRRALEDELAWARAWAAEIQGPEPLALVGSDTHPGNFILRPDGSAVFVDLERVLYGSPAIDLAHASLPTSTSWDRSVEGEVGRQDIVRFYRRYLDRCGPERSRLLLPWLAPSRRLTWLRTMMWCARWQALSEEGKLAIDPGLAAHIRRRIDAFLMPDSLDRMRAEWLEGPPLIDEICS